MLRFSSFPIFIFLFIMVISNYTSTFPKRWRLFFLVICMVLLLVQVYIFTSPSKEILLDEEVKVKTEPVYTAPPPTKPPPPKQSILLGFGGFRSKLPQIQHNFSPEPRDYTIQREARRNAVKKSFVHGWTGYSKLIPHIPHVTHFTHSFI